MHATSDRHVTLVEAHARIDAQTAVLGDEAVPLHLAAGRVLSRALTSPAEWPPADRAAWDGYAVRAADTEGAGEYSPVLLTPDAAPMVRTGDHLPERADAVLAVHAVACSGGLREVTAPVAAGSGVERRGSELAEGDPALPGGRRLRPQDLALLAALGIAEPTVVRRPRVRLVAPHGIAPMLAALVTRDGGVPQAVGEQPVDLVLVGHRLANATADCFVALRLGDRVGLGVLDGVPAVLLPTGSVACFAAYELLAGRAVRRLAGLPGAMPYAVAEAVLERKIVSALGATDLVQVRLSGGGATPLASAVCADGFVVVPEGSEGFAPGSDVRVHLYDAGAQA